MRTMTGDTEAAPKPYVSRWAERDARRRENARLAAEAAHRRASRKSAENTLVKRVEDAKVVLAGKNVAGAIQTVQQLNDRDQDIYALAEKYGQARTGVLRHIRPARKSVETAYLAEAGLGSPDETAEA